MIDLVKRSRKVPDRDKAKEAQVTALVRAHLSEFPLYNPNHYVSVFAEIKEPHTCIRYAPSRNSALAIRETSFALEIKEVQGDVLWISIQEEHRNRGHGRQLYEAIERVLRELNCTSVQTFPSGMGKYFWPRMGFTTFDHPAMIEKILQ